MIILLLCGLMLNACLLSSPRNIDASRKFHPEISDLDNLEMLLLNEQESLYESAADSGSEDHLRLGMPKNRVKRTLGLPSQVEVAGNPKYGNERWIYERSVPTLQGYYKERRVMYFEGGRLVGWESR